MPNLNKSLYDSYDLNKIPSYSVINIELLIADSGNIFSVIRIKLVTLYSTGDKIELC